MYDLWYTTYIKRARNTRAARELMEIDFEGTREPYRFNLSVIKRAYLPLSSSDTFGARSIIEIYIS